MGIGERESILLAIERNAAWLLMDDYDARQAAQQELTAAGSTTQLRGTLGVIMAARLADALSQVEAIELIQRIRRRPDIWISEELCRRVLTVLAAERS